MKKLIFVLALFLTMGTVLTSCSKDDSVMQETEQVSKTNFDKSFEVAKQEALKAIANVENTTKDFGITEVTFVADGITYKSNVVSKQFTSPVETKSLNLEAARSKEMCSWIDEDGAAHIVYETSDGYAHTIQNCYGEACYTTTITGNWLYATYSCWGH